MIIVFFEYGPSTYFFGVTAGKQATRCSASWEEVANELFALQQKEWDEEAPMPEPTHVQGVVQRALEFIEGRWVVVDVVGGVMTIVADLRDQAEYFLVDADEPAEVYVAEDERDAYESAERYSSGFGMRK